MQLSTMSQSDSEMPFGLMAQENLWNRLVVMLLPGTTLPNRPSVNTAVTENNNNNNNNNNKLLSYN